MMSSYRRCFTRIFLKLINDLYHLFFFDCLMQHSKMEHNNFNDLCVLLYIHIQRYLYNIECNCFYREVEKIYSKS